MTNDNTPVTNADSAQMTAKFITKAEVEETMIKALTAAVNELKRHFDVMVETMRHDFQDAHRDGYQHLRNRQSDLELRVNRLERHASLA